jgi:hypothetical protein
MFAALNNLAKQGSPKEAARGNQIKKPKTSRQATTRHQSVKKSIQKAIAKGEKVPFKWKLIPSKRWEYMFQNPNIFEKGPFETPTSELVQSSILDNPDAKIIMHPGKIRDMKAQKTHKLIDLQKEKALNKLNLLQQADLEKIRTSSDLSLAEKNTKTQAIIKKYDRARANAEKKYHSKKQMYDMAHVHELNLLFPDAGYKPTKANLPSGLMHKKTEYKFLTDEKSRIPYLHKKVREKIKPQHVFNSSTGTPAQHIEKHRNSRGNARSHMVMWSKEDQKELDDYKKTLPEQLQTYYIQMIQTKYGPNANIAKYPKFDLRQDPHKYHYNTAIAKKKAEIIQRKQSKLSPGSLATFKSKQKTAESKKHQAYQKKLERARIQRQTKRQNRPQPPRRAASASNIPKPPRRVPTTTKAKSKSKVAKSKVVVDSVAPPVETLGTTTDTWLGELDPQPFMKELHGERVNFDPSNKFHQEKILLLQLKALKARKWRPTESMIENLNSRDILHMVINQIGNPTKTQYDKATKILKDTRDAYTLKRRIFLPFFLNDKKNLEVNPTIKKILLPIIKSKK